MTIDSTGPALTAYRCRTLDGFALFPARGASDAVMQASKPLAALVYTALAPGQRTRRDHVAELLWPRRDLAQARHSLRQCLYRLRQATGGVTLLRLDGLELSAEPVVAFDCLVGEQLATDGNLAQAYEMLRGGFLEGFGIPESNEFESWVEAQRVRFGEAWARAGEALAVRMLEAGEAIAAVEIVEELATARPFCDRTAQLHMTALAATGRHAAALTRYNAYVTLLHHELQTEPGVEVVDYARQLEAQVASSFASGDVRDLDRPDGSGASGEARTPSREAQALSVAAEVDPSISVVCTPSGSREPAAGSASARRRFERWPPRPSVARRDVMGAVTLGSLFLAATFGGAGLGRTSNGASEPAILDASCDPVADGPGLGGVTGVTTLPEGTVISASSTWRAGDTPDLAFDGDTATYWNAGAFPGLEGQWIEVDFGAPQAVVAIEAIVNQFARGFDELETSHQVSLDGRPEFSWTGDTRIHQVLAHTFVSPRETRVVRITTTSSRSWVSWADIVITLSPPTAGRCRGIESTTMDR